MNPNGSLWFEIEEKNFETQGIYNQGEATFIWPPLLQHIPYIERTPETYFSLCFPPKLWSSILNATNERLRVGHFIPTTIGELQKFIGIQLAMTVDPFRGDKMDLWQTTKPDDSVCLPRNYGAIPLY
jgi:hypothetical protein